MFRAAPRLRDAVAIEHQIQTLRKRTLMVIAGMTGAETSQVWALGRAA